MVKQIFFLALIGGIVGSGCSQDPVYTPSTPQGGAPRSSSETPAPDASAIRHEADGLANSKKYPEAMDKRLQILDFGKVDSAKFDFPRSYGDQDLALGDLAKTASQLDAASCRKYATQLLEADAKIPPYTALLLKQQTEALSSFQRVSHNPTAWRSVASGLGLDAKELKVVLSTPVSTIATNIAAAYRSLTDQAGAPYSAMSVRPKFDPYTDKIALPKQAGMNRFQWTKAKLSRVLTIVALQARADRLEKKQGATSLAQDPFGSGPLKQKNGVVYSVGPDTKDDGGKPSVPMDKLAMDSKGDVVAPTF